MQNQYRSIFLPIFVALISGAFIQVAAGLIWGGKLITRIEQLEQRHNEQDKVIERLSERGSQQLPILEQRLKNLEDTTGRNTLRVDALQAMTGTISPVMQAQLDAIRANIVRIEDTTKRAAADVDELYRQLPTAQKRR